MKYSRRKVLKAVGVIPAAAVLTPSLAFASDPWVKFNLDALRPYLSVDAQKAADNEVKSTLYQWDEPADPKTGNIHWVRTMPCSFLVGTYVNDPQHRGLVRMSLVREWAKMLNELAGMSWVATLAIGSKLLNDYIGNPELLEPRYLDPETKQVRLGGGLTREQLKPRTAVYAFIHFKDPVISDTDGFNALFGTGLGDSGLSCLEGHVGPELNNFRWTGPVISKEKAAEVIWKKHPYMEARLRDELKRFA